MTSTSIRGAFSRTQRLALIGMAASLATEVDPARILLELDRALQQTVAPTRSALWLRGDREPAR